MPLSECLDTAGAAFLKILKQGDTECLCLAEETLKGYGEFSAPFKLP